MEKIFPDYTYMEVEEHGILVPDFAVSEVQMRLAAEAQRKDLGTEEIPCEPVPYVEGAPGARLAQGIVKSDPQPGLSEREWADLHAEILAAQEVYGLSYKDSTHRLHLAEVARLKAIQKAHKALMQIRLRINKLVDHELIPPLNVMEQRASK